MRHDCVRSFGRVPAMLGAVGPGWSDQGAFSMAPGVTWSTPPSSTPAAPTSPAPYPIPANGKCAAGYVANHSTHMCDVIAGGHKKIKSITTTRSGRACPAGQFLEPMTGTCVNLPAEQQPSGEPAPGEPAGEQTSHLPLYLGVGAAVVAVGAVAIVLLRR